MKRWIYFRTQSIARLIIGGDGDAIYFDEYREDVAGEDERGDILVAERNGAWVLFRPWKQWHIWAVRRSRKLGGRVVYLDLTVAPDVSS
jgi:hypothetical protein